MKKLVAVGVLVVLILGLTGCSGAAPDGNERNAYTQIEATLNDAAKQYQLGSDYTITVEPESSDKYNIDFQINDEDGVARFAEICNNAVSIVSQSIEMSELNTLFVRAHDISSDTDLVRWNSGDLKSGVLIIGTEFRTRSALDEIASHLSVNAELDELNRAIQEHAPMTEEIGAQFLAGIPQQYKTDSTDVFVDFKGRHETAVYYVTLWGLDFGTNNEDTIKEIAGALFDGLAEASQYAIGDVSFEAWDGNDYMGLYVYDIGNKSYQ